MAHSFQYRWTGDYMIPLSRYLEHCRREFEVNRIYTLSEQHERSAQSHKHFFAQLREYWLNLPEEYAQEFPTMDHLRYYCLVKEGFCEVTNIPCETREAALALLTYAERDPYTVAEITGNVVKLSRAFSQKQDFMSNRQFQESKEKVLDRLAQMTGIPVDVMDKEAGKVA